jgi:hypothetical protein
MKNFILMESKQSTLNQSKMTKVVRKDLRILKAKIKDHTYLEAEYELREEVLNDNGEIEYSPSSIITLKSNRYVHPDMINAMRFLTPHLAFLCELTSPVNEDWDTFETGEIYEDKRFSKFAVTGISIGGQDEHEGVTIIGRKNLRNKRVLNLTTPFMKFEPGEHDSEPYEFNYELSAAVATVVREVIAFIEDGKCALDPQLSLFDEKPADMDFSVEGIFGTTTDITASAQKADLKISK